MIGPLSKLSTIIMAGGQGERLHPLTKCRAKPAVPFGGIYRIIDFTLSNCINSGIRRIHVLTQYKSKSLADHIKMGWNVFHSELNEYIDVIPAQKRLGEHWYRGTADAVFQNFYTLEQENPDYVLILAGDHIYKMDYVRMLEFHIQKGADVTVGVVRKAKEECVNFGVVEVAEDHEVTGFQEKPTTTAGKSDQIHASMGIYLFNVGVLYEELLWDAKQESEHDFGKDVLPRMMETRNVVAYELPASKAEREAYWRDVGTLESYHQANMDLLCMPPMFDLYDNDWPIRTYQPQFPPARILFLSDGRHRTSGEALNSIVCNGCTIAGGQVIRSVLSPEVRIDRYAVVENCILMEGVEVGRHAKIQNAIVDKSVVIPPGTTIGYDLEQDQSRFFVTRSGIAVVERGLTIEPDKRAEERPMMPKDIEEPVLRPSFGTGFVTQVHLSREQVLEGP